MRYRNLFAGVLALILSASACDKNKEPTLAEEELETSGRDEESSSSKSAPGERSQRWKAHDVHTHLSPLSYPIASGVMDEVSLYRVVNMSGGSGSEYQSRHIELADEYDGRIALFANVDWDDIDESDFGEKAAEGLEEAVEIGFAGLKISKQLGLGVEDEDGQLVEVDDRRLAPLWEKAGELGVPVAIHTGDPKAFFEKPDRDNERYEELSLAPSWSFYGDEYPSRESLLEARDRLLERHPDTTFILLHFANNPEDIDYVDELLDEHPNAVVDVAARIAEIGRHDPGAVSEMFDEHRGRIMFATDLGLRVRPTERGTEYRLTLGSISEEPPTLDDVEDFYDDHWRYFETDEEAIEHPVPIQGDWKVYPIALTDEVLDRVYWKNAERIIFAPWLARRVAHDVLDTSEAIGQ